MKRLINELAKHNITPEYNFGRIELQGGDDTARAYYSALLKQNPDLEIKFILELAKTNKDIYDLIDERAAIRSAENLKGDFKSAVRCNFI